MDTERLRRARHARGIHHQSEMAKKLGMTRQNYSNRERGVVKIKADELQKICEVLGLSLEEGLEIISDEKPSSDGDKPLGDCQ